MARMSTRRLAFQALAYRDSDCLIDHARKYGLSMTRTSIHALALGVAVVLVAQNHTQEQKKQGDRPVKSWKEVAKARRLRSAFENGFVLWRTA